MASKKFCKTKKKKIKFCLEINNQFLFSYYLLWVLLVNGKMHN